ncbi:MAG: glycosyl hydrolase [Gammaproteobacteria bacterium]|nr:MAG: glycosyl hydrolase [Gammaproteobacteria bacterium]
MGATAGAQDQRPGLLFSPGPAGWWDSERVSCPRVLPGDGTTPWRMWYYGRDEGFDRSITLPTGRVGLAESPDGLDWTRVRGPLTKGAVLEPHPDPRRFDSAHLGISDIARHGDLYWMWYLGGRRDPGPGGRPGFPMLPGLALSRNGIDWVRVEGPHSGAMLDVGEAGEFDERMASWPQMVPLDDGTWRLYYHTVTAAGEFWVAVAESDDGFRWEKRGKILGPGPSGRFDDLGVATRHVIRHDGRWLMFYEGVGDIGEGPAVSRQLGVAVSDDGLDWQRIDGADRGGSILAQVPAGEGGWDHRLGCPWVVPMADGSLRLYYIGSNERPAGMGHAELFSVHQIGLAVSDGDIRQWRRVEARQ